MVLSVLFCGASVDAMDARTGPTSPVSAAWRRGSNGSAGQPCSLQGIQKLEPDATAVIPAMMPATPSLRLLYVLMLLGREQGIAIKSAGMRGKLWAQVLDQRKRLPDCMQSKVFPEDHISYWGD